MGAKQRARGRRAPGAAARSGREQDAKSNHDASAGQGAGASPHLEALLDLRIWCPWGYGDKAPRRLSGYRKADVSDRSTWSTYREAADAVARNKRLEGVGLMAGDGLVVFDFDRCFDERGADPDVAELLDQLGTYAELSPSGSGVRAICRANGFTLPPNRGKERCAIGYRIDGNERTIYVEREFATITGVAIRDVPIREVEPGTLDAFVERCLRDKATSLRREAGVVGGMLGEAGLDGFLAELRRDAALLEAWEMDPDRAPDGDASYSGWWCSICRKVAVRWPLLSRPELIEIGRAWADHVGWQDHRTRDLGESPGAAAKAVERNVERAVDLVLETEFQPQAADAELARRLADLAARRQGTEQGEQRTDGADQGGQGAQQQAGTAKTDGMTLDELMAAEFPEPRWAVEGILPAGLAILGGAQKGGKTWLCLDLAAAVGAGQRFLGRAATEGDVLVLCLEDNLRRIQDRLRKMGVPAEGGRVHFHTRWAVGKQGLLDLIEWLKDHPGARLIIIDTLKRFTGTSTSKGDAYERAVEQLAPLQGAALAAGVAIVGVTHLRKEKHGLDDWQDRLTGSLGLVATSDTIWMLDRQRGRDMALLRISGRDVVESDLSLVFEKTICRWKPGQYPAALTAALMGARAATRDALEMLLASDRPLSASEIAARRGTTRQTVNRIIQALEADGLLNSRTNGREQLWSVRRGDE